MFTPFTNPNDTLTLGDLVLEKHADHIVMSGCLVIRRDEKGLDAAIILREQMDRVVKILRRESALGNLPTQAVNDATGTPSLHQPERRG
jgi:hypothetical protein